MRSSLAAAALALCLAGSLAMAGDEDGVPVRLAVGERLDICTTGTILCPAVAPICDDVGVATMVDGVKGLELLGVSPGTTLCSARATNKLRAVYRVTVVAKVVAPADAGAAAPSRR